MPVFVVVFNYFSVVAFSENCPRNSDSIYSVWTVYEMKYTMQTRTEHSASTLPPGVIVPPGSIRTILLKTANCSPLCFAAHLILVLILASFPITSKHTVKFKS